jgi:hypothetical protein
MIYPSMLFEFVHKFIKKISFDLRTALETEALLAEG